MELYWVKYLNCLRTRKYILEHKCERNLSLVWLCLATVAFYLNFLETVVLAHPFWTLATFPVGFFIVSFWKNRASSMGKKCTSWTYINILYIRSNICAEWWLFYVSGTSVNKYKLWEDCYSVQARSVQENSKPDTFFTQSVNEGLI